jgi:hypothetical protein
MSLVTKPFVAKLRRARASTYSDYNLARNPTRIREPPLKLEVYPATRTDQFIGAWSPKRQRICEVLENFGWRLEMCLCSKKTVLLTNGR